MAQWKKRTLKLKDLNEGHGWKTKPGYNMFALGRGDVRFEYPDNWIIQPASDNSAIQFHDKKPPDDDCTLAVSCGYLNDEIDWSRLPIASLIKEEIKDDPRNPFFVWDKAIEFTRPHARGAWLELRFIDANEHREAHSRICRAMSSNVLALVTFDFWEADAAAMTPVWDAVLETMVIGQYIEDPTRPIFD